MGSALARLHPAVEAAFFAAALALTAVLGHPVCLALSLLGALGCAWLTLGAGRLLKTLRLLLPLAALSVVINALFVHEGGTVLWFFPWGNALTAEALISGALSAAALSSALLWCAVLCAEMTSDKLTCLAGRLAPSLALVLSTSLRFVPRFIAQAGRAARARALLGADGGEKSLIDRARGAAATFSMVLTWALESSVDSADSMRCRGCGLPGRTAFTPFRFGRRDALALGAVLLPVMAAVTAALAGGLFWQTYPTCAGVGLTPVSALGWAALLVLYFFPVMLEITEARAWAASR